MSLQDRARYWNVTEQERAATYPCDAYLDPPVEGLLRGIDVAAPPPVAFRWLCQLTVAPYSYNPLNLPARRSPRALTPGADRLQVGRDFLVFRIVEFELGRHISGVGRPEFERTYGPVAGTYAVVPRGESACRLVVKLDLGVATGVRRVLRGALAWGDLVMTRKQLRTLAELAERDARPASGPS